MSAYDLEKLACDQLAALLLNQRQIAALIVPTNDYAQVLQHAIQCGDPAAAMWRSGPLHVRADLIAKLSPSAC